MKLTINIIRKALFLLFDLGVEDIAVDLPSFLGVVTGSGSNIS